MWDAVHDETTESLSDGTCSVAFECQPVRVEKSGNGKWKTENGRRKKLKAAESSGDVSTEFKSTTVKFRCNAQCTGYTK